MKATQMSTLNQLPSRDALKGQAKRLRTALAAEGDFVTHSEALELIAKQNGYRDWNTLSAASRDNEGRLIVGAAVSGRYLGQAFTGRLVTLSELGGGARRKVAIQLDQPVDVVRSAHFSSLRRRITGVIDKTGVSAETTSDGVPHLVVTG
jgi:hypothetical protein